MNFRMACPRGYEALESIRDEGLRLSGGERRILIFESPEEAVKGADVVYTDVWTSMGQEEERAQRRRDFAGYQINTALLSQAAKNAILMHPLPAHYGEEIAPGLADSPQSVIFDQAENRLHIQKAILAELLGGS